MVVSKRLEGIPISGRTLCEKAKQLHCKLNCQGPFLASEAAFVTEAYHWRVKNCQLINQQLNLNCDETGLQFRLLPGKTLAAFEKSADGRKEVKD